MCRGSSNIFDIIFKIVVKPHCLIPYYAMTPCIESCLYPEIILTEVAGEGGPHLAPQKFLLSQQFRYLMRCKKYLEKNFLSCLISEIQLFVYIFG